MQVFSLLHEELPSLKVRSFHDDVFLTAVVVNVYSLECFAHGVSAGEGRDHSLLRHAVRLIMLVRVILIVHVSSEGEGLLVQSD
jgi:hypothetical protein